MSYAKAGVPETGHIKTALAKKLLSTFATRSGKFGRPVIPVGHYAGLIDIGGGRLLSLHVDNVGTKVMIARMMGKYDTVGIDCVAGCANDLICTGSEPVSFLDYLAIARPNPGLVSKIADGIVKGCKEAGMAVVGGETAVVPGLLSSVGLDLVGMAAGVCQKDELVLGDEVRKDDVLVGVASSGIHSNGLTLARKVLLKRRSAREVVPELGRSVGLELLEPTRIYVRPVLELLRKAEVHGLAHITGDGFAKLDRVVGLRGLGADVDYLPVPPAVFGLVQREGRVSDVEMFRTFNMGIGLVVICSERESSKVLRVFERHGQKAFLIGSVAGKRGIRVFGQTVGTS